MNNDENGVQNLDGSIAVVTGAAQGLGSRHRRATCPRWRNDNHR